MYNIVIAHMQELWAYLARGVGDIVLVEDCDGGALSGHVGPLGHQLHSRLDQGLSILLANLVLGSTRQGNVILGVRTPGLLALNVLACRWTSSCVSQDCLSCLSLASVKRHCCIAGLCERRHGADIAGMMQSIVFTSHSTYLH